MNYYQDIMHIIALLSTIEANNNTGNTNNCLARFTEICDEASINDRSQSILNVVDTNNDLQSAFEQLSKYCDDSRCKDCVVKKYCSHYIQSVRKANSKDTINMVDLFCGAGGLSLGFVQEGFSIALANDIEECCIETYSHNHPEVSHKRIIQGDIREILKNLNDRIDVNSVDLVVGGPPCQGFSTANRQRLIDDPRNHLYKSYVEAVRIINPIFFVMENVKGMMSVASQVVEDFQRIGYSVSYKILNAKDFGVPQNRERLIYIGNRIGIDNDQVFSDIIQKSTTIPYFVLQDALFGLRPLKASKTKNATESNDEDSGSIIEKNYSIQTNEYIELINQNRTIKVVLNHKARYNNDRDIEIFRRLNQGDRSDDPKISDIMPYSRRNDIFKDKYFKLEEKKVCKTITAHMKFDCNMYIHPTQARGLTPREAARVQSFPDDYFFKGAYTKTYMQIGNSVPPLLSRTIASIVKKYIKEYNNC